MNRTRLPPPSTFPSSFLLRLAKRQPELGGCTSQPHDLNVPQPAKAATPESWYATSLIGSWHSSTTTHLPTAAEFLHAMGRGWRCEATPLVYTWPASMSPMAAPPTDKLLIAAVPVGALSVCSSPPPPSLFLSASEMAWSAAKPSKRPRKPTV